MLDKVRKRQGYSPLVGTGFGEMLCRGECVPVLLKPAGSVEMGVAPESGIFELEATSQPVGKETVVAEFGLPGAGGDHEKVAGSQRSEHLPGVVAIGDGPAKVDVEMFQHRRLEQEPDHVRRLAQEHFVLYVVRDGAACAGAEFGKIRRVAVHQLQRCQVEACGPALASLVQSLEVAYRHDFLSYQGEQGGALRDRKAKVSVVEHGRLTRRDELAQREHGSCLAGQDDPKI